MSPLSQEKAVLFVVWKRAARLRVKKVVGELGRPALEDLNDPESQLYKDALKAWQTGVEPARFVDKTLRVALRALHAERAATVVYFRNRIVDPVTHASWKRACARLEKIERALQRLEEQPNANEIRILRFGPLTEI